MGGRARDLRAFQRSFGRSSDRAGSFFVADSTNGAIRKIVIEQLGCYGRIEGQAARALRRSRDHRRFLRLVGNARWRAQALFRRNRDLSREASAKWAERSHRREDRSPQRRNVTRWFRCRPESARWRATTRDALLEISQEVDSTVAPIRVLQHMSRCAAVAEAPFWQRGTEG